MITIPTITTNRLVLRAFVQRDLEEYATIVGDPEVTKYLGDGHALSRDEAWRQMAGGRLPATRGGAFAVRRLRA